MKGRKHIPEILGIVGACCLGLVMILASGCEKETEQPAQVTPLQRQAPQFVNARCPIMGTPIDPAKVPEELTRMHKGQKVAFCCPGCPLAWDKLSDAEKDAKLAEVTPAQSQ